jgi:hypothetical protein
MRTVPARNVLRSRSIPADSNACRHPRNEVINPAAPGRLFPILLKELDRENALYIPNPYCK